MSIGGWKSVGREAAVCCMIWALVYDLWKISRNQSFALGLGTNGKYQPINISNSS
jgi:hypothetical protein